MHLFNDYIKKVHGFQGILQEINDSKYSHIKRSVFLDTLASFKENVKYF